MKLRSNKKAGVLVINLEGAWQIRFNTGSYCGKANDSIGVDWQDFTTTRPSHGWSGGAVFTRKDAKRLRDFIDEALSKRARKFNWKSQPLRVKDSLQG